MKLDRRARLVLRHASVSENLIREGSPAIIGSAAASESPIRVRGAVPARLSPAAFVASAEARRAPSSRA